MAKEFTYKGKSLNELKEMSIRDFAKLVPARRRRSLLRENTEPQKTLMIKIEKTINGQRKKPIKTHVRNLVILPKMIGLTILVHNGKEFRLVLITEEMIGHLLGEFSLTRQTIKHSAPGIGATKSSAHQSVK